MDDQIACPRCMPPGDPCCPYCDGTYGVPAPMTLTDLTPDLIDGLQPGPETDALVAEARGIVWDESRCRVCGWPLDREGALCRPGDDCSLRPLPERRADTPAPYSTDIRAAMEAVRSLDGPDQFAMFAALREADGHAHPLWMLLFEWDNPALELCRAYLKARLAEGGW